MNREKSNRVTQELVFEDKSSHQRDITERKARAKKTVNTPFAAKNTSFHVHKRYYTDTRTHTPLLLFLLLQACFLLLSLAFSGGFRLPSLLLFYTHT